VRGSPPRFSHDDITGEPLRRRVCECIAVPRAEPRVAEGIARLFAMLSVKLRNARTPRRKLQGSQNDREAAMITGRGGMGSHKHGISGYAPRSPRYKFTQALEANKALAARKRRPELTATTIKEALRDSKRGRP
jgi:hypothetical protein